MSGDTTRPKLEWQHSLESPETVIMKRQRRGQVSSAELKMHTPNTACDLEQLAASILSSAIQNQFQQSNTVLGVRTSGTPDASGHRVLRSPLERFRDAKNEISRAFFHIKNCLVDAQTFLKEALCKGAEEKMESLVEKTKGIEEILDRVHMKVYISRSW